MHVDQRQAFELLGVNLAKLGNEVGGVVHFVFEDELPDVVLFEARIQDVTDSEVACGLS